MWNILYITVTSLVEAIVPCTSKIIGNGLKCFWKRRKSITKRYIILCV